MCTLVGSILVTTSLTGEQSKKRSSLINLYLCRKGPLGSKSANKWFYTSDSAVRQVRYEEVSKTPAYMLFYEKMSDTDEM